jgi:G6PDH family F420-dependent oxidoreductase
LFEPRLQGNSLAMVQIGYTMMTEQAGPRDLVDHLVGAERAGFDFSVTSDHYFPWLDEQGHAPYAWSVLGAAAQATTRIPLMTYVTCPTTRYHPAVVAQKAATMQLLSEGRFRLGLGSGENLNEHVVGGGWPAAPVRLEKLEEAVGIIRDLLAGKEVDRRGQHFEVRGAKLWDLPDTPPPIGVAVSGPRSCAIAGSLADLVIATEPKAELLEAFDRHGGAGKPRVGQLPVCYDPDRDAAVARAHEQFRWFGSGWKVNSELPGTDGFAGATQFVSPDDVAESIPCGDDVDAFVAAVAQYAEAGFDEIALVQIGGAHQEPFLEWSNKTLLPALRDAL